MNPFVIALVLASSIFSQGQEDSEVVKGFAFFEKGDFKKAQRSLSNSLPRARDVALTSWYLSLSNIATSNYVDVKEKEDLLVVASGLLENLARSSSIYAVAAAIGYNDCVLQTSRVRSLPHLLKANEMLKKALKTAQISDVDLRNINKRINYNAFLIAQGNAPAEESAQGKSEGGDKKQGDKSSQSKFAEDKNKGGGSDKEPDNSKGDKTDKKAGALTEKVQAGGGNLDLVPYRRSLQDISKQDAGKLIRDAAKKIRQSVGEEPPE